MVPDPVPGGTSAQPTDSPESPEPRQPTRPTTNTTLPRFSKVSIANLKSQGLTQMEHYIGQNIEDRGGLQRVKEVARNYIESLDGFAVDHPPSCHKPDIPGQGTKQRDQHLRVNKWKDESMKEIHQDVTIQPGYQETLVVNAVLPAEGLVLMEPDWERQPPLLAMPHAISNMTSRYNKADLKKDALTSQR